MSLLETRLSWQKIARSGRAAELRVAVLATFTANPLTPYLGVALEDARFPAEIMVGPYDQIVQECISDDGETARFGPDLLIIWPRLEELWGGRPLPLTGEAALYTKDAIEVAEASLEAARRWRATLIFILPAIPEIRAIGVGDACSQTGVFATATVARESLRLRLAGRRGVLLLDMEEIIRHTGSAHAYNPRMLALARIPFSEEVFNLAGQRVAQLFGLSRQAARKVVVVDSDNTLWGGVVGEDGPDGVDLGDNGPGEAYRAFQSYLLELRRAGVLLALCSKNDEADVWEVFSRPEMRLRREDLSSWRIGWQPKSIGLREMADEFDLGLDSFVFIDDNPAEIAEVQASLPEVACIRMPDDPVDWMSAIQLTGVLDRLPPTQEDLNRTTHYEQERVRRELQTRATSPEDYLAGLGVKVRIFTPTQSDIPRLAQLVAKTNQFNLNCKRRGQAELAEICEDGNYWVRLVHTQDRFGDYGVVGGMIAKPDSDCVEIDTFMLSCRALGRGVEQAMAAYLFEEAARAGYSKIVAEVKEMPRNEPARRFFAASGCEVAGVASPLTRIEWPPHVKRL